MISYTSITPKGTILSYLNGYFDDNLVSGWLKDIEGWQSEDARQKGLETIENINNGADIITSLDEDNHLLAICSYMTITSRLRLSMITEIDKYLAPEEIVESIRKNGVIFIYLLAGSGMGGGKQIIEDLKVLSKVRGKPIFLNSADNAYGFYDKMEFRNINNTRHYYYLP